MSEKPVVTVKEGQIRGIKQVSKFSGTEYYSFFEIPYGRPPASTLRFKDPVKAKPWTGVLDATSENQKEGCIQYSNHIFKFMGTEDCLFNNIHISKLPKKNDILRPVIVNIHPGAFKHGSPQTTIYGSPDYIMHHDIVYVGISYRLHILGFLNLRLKECSGNQGIKDVLLSLRWIKDNIRSFGGNPENITLLGSSGGSVIIHVLMLSPSAKGLFHKAVLMGGYMHSPIMSRHESNEHHAREVAKLLGYTENLQDNKKLLLFLKQQDAVYLIQAWQKVMKDAQKTIAPFFPSCIFCLSHDRGDIVPESWKELIKSMARIPVMIGFSQLESICGFLRTVHASDFSYWNRSADPQDKQARQMVETFTKLVTTFARTGDPNYENLPVTWRPSTPEEPCYLSINDPLVMVDGKLNKNGLEFWNSIKKKYATE